MVATEIKPPLHVFLSFADEDRESAQILRKALQQQSNVQIFTTDKLSAGEDWLSQLKAAISSCDVFVLLITPKAVSSSWVLQELGAAWGLKKPILGIYTDLWDTAYLPVSLKEDQLVDIKYLEHPSAVASLLHRYEEKPAA